MAESWTGSIGDAVGFVGAGAALGAVKQQNDGLQQQISSGHLKMNPDSANAAAKVYEDKAQKVQRLVRKANRLRRISGLGDYPNATILAQVFDQKATDGQSGATALLHQFAEELLRKADLFRQAAKDYVATDEQNAQDMRRGIQ